MIFIKQNIKLLILMAIAILISGVTYYFNMILYPQLEMVETLKSQNQLKTLELQALQQELKNLPQRENELAQIQIKIESLKDKVPTYDTAAGMMVEIIQYMEIYQFQDLDITMGESEKQEGEEGSYYKVPVTIRYTSTYDETISLLEEVNRSYQIIKVDYLSINNSTVEQVYLEQTSQECHPILSGDIVRTEVILGLYYTDFK